jgi:hypothetical protein
VDNPEKLATKDTQDEEKHNTKCGEQNYKQTNTNNVNKTRALPKTTACKDEPSIAPIRKS